MDVNITNLCPNSYAVDPVEAARRAAAAQRHQDLIAGVAVPDERESQDALHAFIPSLQVLDNGGTINGKSKHDPTFIPANKV